MSAAVALSPLLLFILTLFVMRVDDWRDDSFWGAGRLPESRDRWTVPAVCFSRATSRRPMRTMEMMEVRAERTKELRRTDRWCWLLRLALGFGSVSCPSFSPSSYLSYPLPLGRYGQRTWLGCGGTTTPSILLLPRPPLLLGSRQPAPSSRRIHHGGQPEMTLTGVGRG